MCKTLQICTLFLKVFMDVYWKFHIHVDISICDCATCQMLNVKFHKSCFTSSVEPLAFWFGRCTSLQPDGDKLFRKGINFGEHGRQRFPGHFFKNSPVGYVNETFQYWQIMQIVIGQWWLMIWLLLIYYLSVTVSHALYPGYCFLIDGERWLTINLII